MDGVTDLEDVVMGFFTSARASRARSKLQEEELWAAAAEEVASGVIRPGLWAQALAESSGDEGAAKSRYLKLRFETMKDEAALAEEQSLTTKRNRERALRKVAKVSGRFAYSGGYSDELLAALLWLKDRNYHATKREDYWIIREHYGGRHKCADEREVISYAMERGFGRT